MHNYAMMLSHGSNGLKVDKAEAARYYKMAADLGNVKSMNSYAAMLYNGHGVPQDMKEGIRYFQMGADKGNASAMYNLGCKILENVANGSKEAAARYIKIAAERVIVSAMEKYAKLLEDGIGVAVNRDSAERYLKMANEAKMAKKAK